MTLPVPPHPPETEENQELQPQTLPDLWPLIAEAALEKKAEDLRVLDLRGITSFTDFFLICTGSNQRQCQAIVDEIQMRLKREYNLLPMGTEGYERADWVLTDFGSTVVHVFSPGAREYYDLERLWRQARILDVPGAGDSRTAANSAEADEPLDAEMDLEEEQPD